MRTVRASEIGSYMYCQRAWWYSVRGIESQNQAALDRGRLHHRKNWRSTVLSKLLRGLAFVFLLLGLVFAFLHLLAN